MQFEVVSGEVESNYQTLLNSSTAIPRISHRGLICKNEFLGGAFFEGGLFQSMAFSSKFDRKNDIIFSINKTKSHKRAISQTKFTSQ